MPVLGDLLRAFGQGANDIYMTAQHGPDWEAKRKASNTAELDAAIKRALVEVAARRDQAGVNADAEVGAAAMPDLAGRPAEEVSAVYKSRLGKRKSDQDFQYGEAKTREQDALAEKNSAWDDSEEKDRIAAMERAVLAAEASNGRTAATNEMRMRIEQMKAARGPKGPSARFVKVDDPDHPGRQKYITATPGQTDMSGFTTTGATVANREAGADYSNVLGDEVLKALESPELQAQIGPIMGRYNSLKAAAGAGDPIAQELVGQLRSFAALQPGIHGMRNFQMVAHMEELLNTAQNPAALAAGLRGILAASRTIVGKDLNGQPRSGVAPRTKPAAAPAAPGAPAAPSPFDDALNRLIGPPK
jgi:hypothetical protein